MTSNQENTSPQRGTKYRWLRRIARVTLSVFVFLILVVLFIRSPWGQGIIVDQAVSYLENKTGTQVSLEKAFITFDGDLKVEGLYVEDLKKDTLVYSKSLEAHISLLPLIKGTAFKIDDVEWNGLKARIHRRDTVEGFNYQFLIDAFATAADTTASKPMDYKIGEVLLTAFDIVYEDQVENINATTTFDQLILAMNSIDLEKMIIDIDVVTLQNATINYDQKELITRATTSLKEESNSTITPLPFIKLGTLTLDEVKVNYKAIPSGISIEAAIGSLETSISKADLQHQDIAISYIDLVKSSINVHIIETNKAATPAQPASFKWPEMKLSLDRLNIEDNNFLYTLNGAKPSPTAFNPNSILLTQVNLDLQDFALFENQLDVKIHEFSLNESSGIILKELKGVINVTDHKLNLDDLLVRFNNSSINGATSLSYANLGALINQPENADVNLALADFKIELKDLYQFEPSLKSNVYFNKLAANSFYGNLIAQGDLNLLYIKNAAINWGDSTTLRLRGTIKNPTDLEQLYVDVPYIKASTNSTAVLTFIDEADLGIKIPNMVQLQASAKGSLKDLEFLTDLKTSYGDVAVNGSFKNDTSIAFDIDTKVNDFNLQELLQMPDLGDLSVQFNLKGSGNDLKTLDADLDGVINNFCYADYDFKDLPLQARMKNGVGTFISNFKNQSINLTLNSQIDLTSEVTSASATVDVIGADLKALGIATRGIKAAGKVQVDFKGNSTEYNISSTINDGIAVYDKQSYLLGKVKLAAFVKSDSTSIDVNNKMLQLKLRSNAQPGDLTLALKRHLRKYISTSQQNDSVKPVVMKIDGKITPSPILRDVILPSLQALDTIHLAVDFNEQERKLNSDIKVSYLKYGGSEIDSLMISSASDAQNFEFQIGFKEISSGPIDIQRTILSGVVSDNVLNLDFDSYDKEERLVHFASTLSRKRDENGLSNLIFNLSLDDLILNKQPWSIPNTNEIAVGENRIKFTDFKLTNNLESIELSGDQPNATGEHIALLLSNFKLQSFLSLLNPDEQLATGKVNGAFILNDLYGNLGFLADLQIDDLNALQVPLGKLSLDAKSRDASSYDLEMSLSGPEIDIMLTGDYQAGETEAALNFDLVLDKISMKTIDGLAGKYLKDGSGSINGVFKLTGTTAAPVYDGALNFNNSSFTVAMLDTNFTLKDEKIEIDNDGITMNQLEIRDAKGDLFTIDGAIDTKNIFNPSLDLKLKATNFTALNSTQDDNDLYYGNATVDVNASITGTIQVPTIDLSLDIKDITDFTYVIPAADLDIVERDGVVQFVNKENPDAILTQVEEEKVVLSGIDLNANLKIGNGATIHIIVDPTTGDQLQISGNGELKYRMTPNGRMTLTGRYEIDNGFYELNLYEIVSRKFDLAQGGSVTWSGDPFNADIDVSAIYKIETSASALMASQISGADVATKNKFRQELPFLVYLNVDGELTQPDLSFKIDLPEDERGAIGGQVYGRLQQLNSQDQELNKQVFSLLVLNKFFPTSGADGSSGGTAAIARDNLNQALSDQLNQFGDKLLGDTGVDLDFGLNSFTDYQGANTQDRTQLDVTASKKLLDDRLIVSVGSEVDIQGSAREDEEAPVIGNVSIEYLFSESGRWRLKGFRKNEYDNVIDGQLIVSGISLIFTREFNEFKNLFTNTVQEEKEKALKEEETRDKTKKQAQN